MSESSSIDEFRNYIKTYIKSRHCFGENGWDQRAEFVPRQALVDFWTSEKITSVLCSPSQRIIAHADTIRQHYVTVFSVWVFNGHPEKIRLFIRTNITDSTLPLPSVPHAYSDTDKSTTFEEFMKCQWLFCPMALDQISGPRPHMMEISPSLILPIVERDKIKPNADDDNDDSVLYRVKLHPECSSVEYVVFKEYRRNDDDTEELYRNEAEMYSHLDDETSDSIIKYFGSFERLGQRTIVLEYAAGDTLQEFFKRRAVPSSRSDRMLLWGNIFGLLKGLVSMHDLTRNHHHSLDTYRIKGTHQDIRPQNILVCNTTSDTVDSFGFKFADLGKSNIRIMRNGAIDHNALNQVGNGMYGGPETVRRGGVVVMINEASDIWSFGGIASECLIWSIWGEHGRMTYQKERNLSTQKTMLRGGEHEGAFHDGERVLDVVRRWHQRVDQESDELSGLLSQLILNHMLVADPRGRSTAERILQEWTDARAIRDNHRSDTMIAEPSRRSVPMASVQPRANSTPTTKGKHHQFRHAKMEPVRNAHQETASSSKLPLALLEDGLSTVQTPDSFDQNAAKPGPDPSFDHWPSFEETEHQPRRPLAKNRKSVPATSQSPAVETRRRTIDGFAPLSARTQQVDDSSESQYESCEGSPMSDKPQKEHNWISDYVHEPLTYDSDDEEELPTKSEVAPAYSKPRNVDSWIPTDEEMHNMATASSMSHPQASTSQSHVSNARIPPGKGISIDEVWFRCVKGKSNTSGIGRALGFRSEVEDTLEAFPSLESVLLKVKGSQGRDQMFLVDDAFSMAAHREQIGRTCRVLGHLLKRAGVDPDKKFELYFTSQTTSRVLKHASQLQVAVEKHRFKTATCDMKWILDELVTRVIKENKPVSIYVLTNGHWNLDEPTSICDVEHPIARLVRHIHDNNQQDNWAVIQFIRFFDPKGNNWKDDCGKGRMAKLDDGLGLDIDIVDTRDFDDDVEMILLGAVSRDADNNNRALD